MKEKWSIVLEPWFIVAIFLAMAHQILQKRLATNIAMIDSYLDPLTDAYPVASFTMRKTGTF